MSSVAPGDGEVQINVAYRGICGTDLHVFHGGMDARVGLHRIIGHEMSGEITAIGPNIQDFKPGDRVVLRRGVSRRKKNIVITVIRSKK